jgi:predicted nuclease of predicted toxin-antitoxin system
MKFKIDENLPIECAEILRESGFEADTVYDEGLNGNPDSIIFNVCTQERMVLITLDLDFSDIRTYPPNTHFGIIIFRLNNQSKLKIIQKLKRVIHIMGIELLEGCIWIVDEQRIRIRGGPSWN